MRLEARPGLSVEQRLALFDAASLDMRAELAAGAESITAEIEDDGATIVITSDRLDAMKAGPVKA